MSERRPVRAVAVAAIAAALALGTSACGSDEPPARQEVSTTEHNAADSRFASEMLQHHAQALSMVDLTLERDLDPEVTDLAEQVRAAQAPEIETFSDWLTEWDEPVPETMRDHSNAGHGEHDMGESMEGMDTSMPGMMSAGEMTALEDASDAGFQTMWLEMMIEHHEGAVEMARTEIETGRYAPAIDLARDIVDTQTAEVETMEGLLGS